MKYAQITTDTPLEQVIAIAQDCSLPMELTAMDTNACLFRNSVKLEETEGVVWQPQQYKHLNSMFFWMPFMDDFHCLIQSLPQTGAAENFSYRNARLANDGYCDRVSTYGVAGNGAFRWNVLHSFQHNSTSVLAG